jgi:predicted aldo/keto reductase-like oxidoreductase
VACTTCGYCQPCPNGVAIPEVLSAYNTSAMFDARKNAAGVYRAFIMGQGHGADLCLACGECEPKCPQGIPIVEKLKEAHAHLTS